ncbi:MAG: hypothetical protein KME16_23340 [Scytolyngbya sp. HA4215-MV1]|jgi:hypothetical protein|nr:hypothetical protein [Scytolyngbya sp. HA4215-MV1]
MGIRRQILATVLAGSSLALAPMPTLAQAKTINLTLESEAFQPFSALKQEATTLAQKSIEQGFRQDSQTTEVTVTIVGDRNGQFAPILTVKVTRDQWQKSNNINQWARFFDNTEILLGFLTPIAATPAHAASARGGISQTFPTQRSPLISQGFTSHRERLEGTPGFRDD